MDTKEKKLIRSNLNLITYVEDNVVKTLIVFVHGHVWVSVAAYRGVYVDNAQKIKSMNGIIVVSEEIK